MTGRTTHLTAFFGVLVVILHGTQFNLSPSIPCNLTTRGGKKRAETLQKSLENVLPAYKPSPLEDFIVNNSDKHGMDSTDINSLVPMCSMLRESNTRSF